MTAAYWAAPLTDDELAFRISALVSELDQWGPVRWAERSRPGVREYRVEVRIDTLRPAGARLIFGEAHLASPSGWLLSDYAYNFIDDGAGRFFGYHYHPIPGVRGPEEPITHVHCRPLAAARGDHFRATWVGLREAQWEFISWAVDPALIPICASLKPLVADAP